MTPPAPRAPLLTGRAAALVVVLLSLVCGAIGAAIFALGVSSAGDGWALWRQGVEVRGEVVGKEVRRRVTRGGGTNHVLLYAFPAGGAVHRAEAIVDEEAYRAAPVGAPVAVRHVAGRPGVSALAGEWGVADGLLFPAFGLLTGTLLLGCAAYLLFAGVRGVVRGPPPAR